MNKTSKIPRATITRLSLYYRRLELLEFDGHRMVSSDKLSWLCQVNPAQVRKDLGYFGEFGIRGVGYDVRDLQNEIKRILAVNRAWNMGIAGIGNLGSSLLGHRNFQIRGFNFVAAFDSDPEKIGRTPLPGPVIRDIRELKQAVRELGIEIGVITTPPSAAQGVADLFVDANVNAILNFSPVEVRVPCACLIENLDITIQLDILTYKLRHELGIPENP